MIIVIEMYTSDVDMNCVTISKIHTRVLAYVEYNIDTQGNVITPMRKSEILKTRIKKFDTLCCCLDLMIRYITIALAIIVIGAIITKVPSSVFVSALDISVRPE